MDPLSYGLGRRPIALVAEDEPLVRMDIADVLLHDGFKVTEVADTSSALDQFTQPHLIDLLVTDVAMPGPFDGLALAQIVARSWPRTRLLICSGHARPEAADLPDRASFLAKPFTTAGLLAAVRAKFDVAAVT